MKTLFSVLAYLAFFVVILAVPVAGLAAIAHAASMAFLEAGASLAVMVVCMLAGLILDRVLISSY